jgi:hypothetical protein
MKPIIAVGVALIALAGSEAVAEPLKRFSGSLKPSRGYASPPAPTFNYYGQQPPSNYGYTPPRPPAMSNPDRFQPYQGTSVYSNRGGINAYPTAPKPKGYLSPYGAGGTSTYVNPYGQ